MKRLFGIFCTLALLIAPTAGGVVSAKEKEAKVPKAVTEYKKGLESINKQINMKHKKKAALNLNQVETEEYSYTYDDGSVTTITVYSVDVLEEDKDKVTINSEGEISLAGDLTEKSFARVAAAASPVTTVKSGVVKTTWELTFWQQKIYGSWTYTPGVRGSLTAAKHTSEPTATAGMGVTVGTPKPFVTILPENHAAHIGSTCRFTVKGPKDVTAWTTDQRAIMIVDINGNCKFVDDTN